jgi:hypothetical protein
MSVLEEQTQLSGAITALEQEKRLSELFNTYTKKLKEARGDLRELRMSTFQYKSYSSKANDANRAVAIYKNKLAACLSQFDNQVKFAPVLIWLPCRQTMWHWRQARTAA